ncbi:MAG: IS3 family transposase [Smithellaceae bacterium]|nr:IS3 family transposase [Smithellaceae bacterium]
MVIDRPDQVWAADITYICMQQGFIYLVAIMDWYSRYVLSWETSITLDTGFCINAMKRALHLSQPEIMNTDQGVQFTSAAFIGILENNDIRISMDGRGRAFDNIFIERLWRSVKYAEVYLHQYTSVSDAKRHLDRYFRLYNNERLHQSLDYRTPYEVYFKEQAGCHEPKAALAF